MAAYYTYNAMNEFVYFDFAATSKSALSLQIKSGITLANRYYYSLSKQLGSGNLSQFIKLSLILFILLYGAKA